MKHPVPVAVVLLVMFLTAQLVGLFIVRAYIDIPASEKASQDAGKPVTVYSELPYGFERPAVDPAMSFILIGISILVGTVLVLILARFRMVSLWKIWFFLAILIVLTFAFSAFIPAMAAGLISLTVTFFRVIKPNVLVHNLSELFVYGGLAAIFVPILNLMSASILLLLLAAYDIVAVFKSKHMISLAKFQASNRVFAGLFVPKQLSLKSATSSISPATTETSSRKYADSGSYAVIGGGDIGFPLLFAGAAMPVLGFNKALVIPFFAAAALAILLIISKKGRFYPAMPFIAAGCFLGYWLLKLI